MTEVWKVIIIFLKLFDFWSYPKSFVPERSWGNGTKGALGLYIVHCCEILPDKDGALASTVPYVQDRS